jgi:D-mannonate dehydratase
MDDGYLDMQAVMNALVACNFGGLVVPDHIPELALDTDLAVKTTPGSYESPFRPVGVAYSAGLLNAYLQNALRIQAKG